MKFGAAFLKINVQKTLFKILIYLECSRNVRSKILVWNFDEGVRPSRCPCARARTGRAHLARARARAVENALTSRDLRVGRRALGRLHLRLRYTGCGRCGSDWCPWEVPRRNSGRYMRWQRLWTGAGAAGTRRRCFTLISVRASLAVCPLSGGPSGIGTVALCTAGMHFCVLWSQ